MGKAYSKEVRDAVVNAGKSGMKVKKICRKFHGRAGWCSPAFLLRLCEAPEPRKIDIDPRVVAKAIRLTWLSPKIIHQIISGETDLTLGQLRQSFPALWEEQEKLFLK